MRAARVHLPNLHAHLPSIPMVQARMDRASSHNVKTRNPFPYMSGSIAATQKRRLAKSPKPSRKFNA